MQNRYLLIEKNEMGFSELCAHKSKEDADKGSTCQSGSSLLFFAVTLVLHHSDNPFTRLHVLLSRKLARLHAAHGQSRGISYQVQQGKFVY